jgi:hypothetical protein
MPDQFGGIPIDDDQKPDQFGGIPINETQPKNPAQNAQQPSLLSRVGSTIGDLASGAGKGMASTLHGGVDMLRSVPPLRALDDFGYSSTGRTAPSEQQWQQFTEPTNTAQKIGKYGEQAAEFMIPGMGEEKAGLTAARYLPQLGKYAPLLGRTAAAAVGSGAVNKLQGGSFGTGAAMGAGGSVIGQGLHALAPGMAESAMGVTAADRGFQRTPGRAFLDETKGVRPETVARTGNQTLGRLNPELEGQVAAAPGPAYLQPARDVISNGIAGAHSEPMIEQLQPFAQHLARDPHTGLPLANAQSPTGILNIKRGLGDYLTWKPGTIDKATKTGREAYGALDQELDRTVPQAAQLNQRISSLIPAVRRAEAASRAASLPQKIAGRLAARTGALVGATAGGAAGYHQGGIPGAVGGAMLGITGPELLADPAAQMLAARLANSGMAARSIAALGGAGLQATRKKKDDESGSGQ